MSGVERLSAARTAIEQGQFQDALDHLDAGGPAAESPEALELRANAAYGNGDFEDAVAAWEAMFAQHSAAGENDEAARASAMIAMYLMMDTGLMAPVRGWLHRADRLAANTPEAPTHAIVAMVRTYERFMCGDMAEARRQSELAIKLGTRLGFHPAVVIGQVAGARITIYEGDLAGGLDQLDEIAVLLMSGEVDPLTTGMMYCELICAAQGLALYERANEWTEMMERWRHGAAFGGINGRCRVHRAEMLRLSGPCEQAEREALVACDELRPWMRREFGWPLVELGNIRLRKGDLAGAEEAFLAAHAHAWSPHPGMALLRLAQGRSEEAAELIDAAIAHPFAIPSKERPPFGDLCLAPLLDAQVEIAYARGEAETARQAADRLGSIADSYPSAALTAAASLADARASLLAGGTDKGIAGSSAAMAAWTEIGAPYEAACARMVLGDAYQAAGNRDSARLEWQAAVDGFAVFGASGQAERAARLVRSGNPTPAAHVSGMVRASFVRQGDSRAVGFSEDVVVVRDLKGYRYLGRLLSDPRREFHVLDLAAVETGALPTKSQPDEATVHSAEGDTGLPLLDDAARSAYRRRLLEVEEDIDEAREQNDLGRLELAERDREYLITELARDAGFAGGHRTIGGTSERARSSVTRSIRYALERLSEASPALAAHLRQCVRTGTYCSYIPDALAPVEWQT